MEKEQIVQIVLDVIMQMEASKEKIKTKKALLITESDILDPSLLQRVKNITNGYVVTLAGSTEAAKNNSLGYINSIVGLNDLGMNKQEFIKEFDIIIFVNLTINSISKIAHIIIDNSISELFFYAIENRKKIIINNPLFSDDYMDLTQALKKELAVLISKIISYGAEELDRDLNKNCRPASTVKKVITMQDLESNNRSLDEITIGPKTVITPLASDYIRDKKIIVKRCSDVLR